MKPLAIVTATSDPATSGPCRDSWRTTDAQVSTYVVINGAGPPYAAYTNLWHDIAPSTWVYSSAEFLGVVPAFALGVAKALADGAEIVACLHDDLELHDPHWVTKTRSLFQACPRAGLLGFGGARGLGDPRMYKIPYGAMQLARRGFMSNMRDAESHGVRTEMSQPVACLDGFSQVGLREYWLGYAHINAAPRGLCPTCWGKGFAPSAEGLKCGFCDGQENSDREDNLFQLMARQGIVHHAYDAALGCYAARLSYQVWLLPIACHHYGGRTAVGDPNYQMWARKQTPEGDQGFWKQAHEIVYNEFTDVLPILDVVRTGV